MIMIRSTKITKRGTLKLKNNLSPTKFNYIILLSVTIILLSLAVSIFLVDPFFHYRYPNLSLNYRFDSERYQNDGIIRHFEYDAIITGTSMTENFKKTECDTLFNVNSVKIPFSGSTFKETCDTLKRSFIYNENTKMIILSLDYQNLLLDSNLYNPQYTYPTYLYDDNVLNDVNYLLNKDVALKTLSTLKINAIDNTTLSFDDYEYWSDRFAYGKEAIMAINKRAEIVSDTYNLSQEEKQLLLDNIRVNISSLAQEHPNTTFYLFFPPYSILYYDTLKRQGELDKLLLMEQMVIEELLQYNNVQLYSMANETDVISNLDNYIDTKHYSGRINSWILQCMNKGNYLLTSDNYKEYVKDRFELLTNYDYDSIYE